MMEELDSAAEPLRALSTKKLYEKFLQIGGTASEYPIVDAIYRGENIEKIVLLVEPLPEYLDDNSFVAPRNNNHLIHAPTTPATPDDLSTLSHKELLYAYIDAGGTFDGCKKLLQALDNHQLTSCVRSKCYARQYKHKKIGNTEWPSAKSRPGSYQSRRKGKPRHDSDDLNSDDGDFLEDGVHITRAAARIPKNYRYNAPHAEPSNKPSPYDAWSMDEVWTEFGRTQSLEIRNYLMEKYLPLVRINAETIYQRIPDEVDVQDLMSAGIFGLEDAIQKYDPSRGYKFETYAVPRIRGSILDELRLQDWVPRLVRTRTATTKKLTNAFRDKTGRNPDEDEIKEVLRKNGHDPEKYLKDTISTNIFSLTREVLAQNKGNKPYLEGDRIADKTSRADVFTNIVKRDLKTFILKGLSRTERAIICLYYYEGLSLKEIGSTVDISESRVSQIHFNILTRLKARMTDHSITLDDKL